MLRIILPRILSLPFLTVMMGCVGVEFQSNWVHRQPMIDGHLDDWNSASFVVFDDLHVSVDIGNDSSFLYLGGRIANRSLQYLVQQAGITMWFDPERRKQKNIEIHFPASSVALTNLNRGGFLASMTEEERIKLRQQADELGRGVLVINRQMVESRVYKPGNESGIEAMISSSEGLASFEVRIPLDFAEVFPKFKLPDPGMKVHVGFELGGSMDRIQPDKVERPRADEIEIPGRGNSRGSSRRQDSELPDRRTVWLEVSLAQQH